MKREVAKKVAKKVVKKVILVAAMGALRIDITKCLRCGKDHSRLLFKPFKRVSQMGFNRWARCPVTKEPLLLGDLCGNAEITRKMKAGGHRAVLSVD